MFTLKALRSPQTCCYFLISTTVVIFLGSNLSVSQASLVSDSFLLHESCYNWQQNLLWFHLISNFLIGMAHYLIPITLAFFVLKHRDLPFKWFFLFFGAFITACGTTYWIEVWTLWYPHYWLFGFVKAIAAAMSIMMAIALMFVIPRAFSIAGINQLREATETPETDIAAHHLVVTELRRLKSELEDRVEKRTFDLQQANLTLAFKEEEIRSVVENMVDCVITIDEDGIIRSANPAVEKVFGYTAAQVLGRPVTILMPEPHCSAHDHYIRHYRETGQARIIGIGREVEGLHKNGERIALDLAISEYFVHGQRFFTGILRDIRERTRIMKDLEQARYDADRANRAKSDFLAAMSHEIRTPMNGVLGMIEVLHQSGLTGQQLEMANLIRESAFSLLGIIDGILDFSKIEAGQLEIENAPMSVVDIVEKVCDILDYLAIKKGVELTLFADPMIPDEVLGDALRLRQILLNLAGNAIKFSSGERRTGRVSIRASLAKRDTKQVTVEIKVADNGIGMGEETQRRIFTPFTQADASTARYFGGTGLGLVISRNLVQLMGGDISVQSAPGRGSTFTVCLPLALPSTTQDASVAASELAGLSCLLVGGPEGLAADLAVYLAHAGAVVERVTDLAVARSKIGTLPPCLWLLMIDTGQDVIPVEELRAIGDALSGLNSRCVIHESEHDQLVTVEPRSFIIARGRRRMSRSTIKGFVTLDGNNLHRRSFIRMVAVAAGLAREEEALPLLEKGLVAPPTLSREEALQRGRLILVVEDNEINQQVISHQLRLLGYVADIVSNGYQALEQWQTTSYGLLLTDLHMPGMDGYQLVAAIRAKERGVQHIPIIALSAIALQGEMERCRHAGMDDYLSKPAQMTVLRTMLEKWLQPATDSCLDFPASLIQNPLQVTEIEPINLNTLRDFVGDDAEVHRAFLCNFRVSLSETTAELKAACESKEAARAGALAHKLKSSARCVGALDLGELCAAMERAGDADDIEELISLLPHFNAEVAAVDYFIMKKYST